MNMSETSFAIRVQTWARLVPRNGFACRCPAPGCLFQKLVSALSGALKRLHRTCNVSCAAVLTPVEVEQDEEGVTDRYCVAGSCVARQRPRGSGGGAAAATTGPHSHRQPALPGCACAPKSFCPSLFMHETSQPVVQRFWPLQSHRGLPSAWCQPFSLLHCFKLSRLTEAPDR